ncbi:GntR family transcriptional regulator [Alkalicoccus urumqiensis]|uniref:GntR family transcriptional regulator n=1 Tax=Alkalicoccus urumqiensis TaxID=1548213 RepID=A0A2P6ME29_ALKUR|nr:GntR family transcriptional regulator [Alkalicoccus urumqiensis]PRO64538.1 GntR family transcriptional regulator [Alkalicoccus urumqiensis]
MLHDKKPIFMQIKEHIADQIVRRQLLAHEQAPSTNQLVQFYKVNHLTVSKGIQALVDEGVLYKKRGVGMFVAEDAREVLLERRRRELEEAFIAPLLREAEMLELSEEELIARIRGSKRRMTE